MKSYPKILSNFEKYLQFMNVREDLESYMRTKNTALINTICDKIIKSDEIAITENATSIKPNIINAVVLFIAN